MEVREMMPMHEAISRALGIPGASQADVARRLGENRQGYSRALSRGGLEVRVRLATKAGVKVAPLHILLEDGQVVLTITYLGPGERSPAEALTKQVASLSAMLELANADVRALMQEVNRGR